MRRIASGTLRLVSCPHKLRVALPKVNLGISSRVVLVLYRATIIVAITDA
jgi:hypothetical protein